MCQKSAKISSHEKFRIENPQNFAAAGNISAVFLYTVFFTVYMFFYRGGGGGGSRLKSDLCFQDTCPLYRLFYDPLRHVYLRVAGVKPSLHDYECEIKTT